MEKEMRGKVIIYRSRGEHPTIQCEFLDYFDSKKYILKQKCMYGFLTIMLINALLFCQWNYEKMTLKSRIHYQNCRIFQYCSDSPNLKLCFMKTAHRATYIQWLWREIYFWTFMCFPRSRRNDKVHARIYFLDGLFKKYKVSHSIFWNSFINFIQQRRENWICNWMILCFFGSFWVHRLCFIWIKVKSSYSVHLVTNFHISILW